MKTFALLAAATLALGSSAFAQETVTSQRVLPNGDVRTSTTVHDGGMGMNGGMVHRMDDRGVERTVVRERVDGDDDHGRGWHRGHHARRVCVTRWHHHERVRKCWMRRS